MGTDKEEMVTVLRVYDAGGFNDLVQSAMWDRVLNATAKIEVLDHLDRQYPGSAFNILLEDMPREEAEGLPEIEGMICLGELFTKVKESGLLDE